MESVHVNRIAELVAIGALREDGPHAIVIKALGQDGLDYFRRIMLGDETYDGLASKGEAARAFVRDCKSMIGA
jgi:hypothetical protein